MVEEVSPAELREKLQAEETDVTVVDTRREAAYERGHVPGADNLPLSRLPERVTQVDWSEEVVFVCQKGISSLQAGRLLESYEGLDDDTTVASLEGGYEDWDYDVATTDH